MEMKRTKQKKQRYIDIEQVDQHCINMSIDLQADDDAFPAETPVSIQNKFRNNSVISSVKDRDVTYLSSDIMSQNSRSPRIQELKKIKQRSKDNSFMVGPRKQGFASTNSRVRHGKSVGNVSFEDVSQLSPTCQSKLRMRQKIQSMSTNQTFISSVR